MPIVVVLPVPFTPTINSTAGSPLRSIGARPVEATSARISISLPRTAPPSAGTAPDSTSCSSRSTTAAVVGRPGVGKDQRLLEPFPGLLVDPIEEAGGDLLAQGLAALGEALAQAAEDAAALPLRFTGGPWLRGFART